MHIYCTAEQRSAIKEIIQVESGKRGLDFLLLDNSDSIIIAEFGGTYVDIHETDDAMKQTQEMLTKIKDRFPSVTINGSLSIGSKNYRIEYFFDSPENCRDVTVELTLGGVPFSKCWFPYMTNGNYGMVSDGFVSREDFERFIKITSRIWKKQGLSFEEFIHSDLLEEIFYEVNEELFDIVEDEECTDKAFVITGKLNLFENRDEFVEYIEDLGGKVVGSVSSKTDFLICNDTASTSSKMKKAKELGVEVITEEEFIQRFGDPDDFGLADKIEEFMEEIEEFPQPAWADELHALYLSAWEKYKKEGGNLVEEDE